MDGSIFRCKTKCIIGIGVDLYFEREILLSYPRRKCDYGRYQFEYPCKYTDYLDLSDAGICIKTVNSVVPWREAKARCVHRYKGTLIKITSKAMNDEINKLNFLSSGGYWIGLSNIWLRHLHNDTFGWLDETQPATYMNRFKNPLGTSTGEEWCVITEPGDYWDKAKCYPNEHEFICQKMSARNPGPPSLSFKFSHGHRHAYIGYDLHAQCSAFTELGASVKFRMEDNINLTEIGSHDIDYTSLAVEQFVEVDDRCLPMTIADLKVKVTTRLLGTDFKCCWYLQETLMSCSDSIRATLRYLPKRPVLTVKSSYYLSIGDHVTATCSACVGTGGQLVWALDMLDVKLQWSSQFYSTQDSPPFPGGRSVSPQTTSLVEGWIPPILFFFLNQTCISLRSVYLHHVVNLNCASIP
ncbi:hypothetical protein EGW08_021814 [Elysia chlorotica]|uniref:C-type lectin domain-containing protein n=1 Tax=Elysia chlorotica TaxID=188477 RepID=A0A433SMN3_ELYCH|nr:hypothetical protein EGW08_021814 [Elysia chlorotica]